MEEARQPATLARRLKPERWFLILAVALHLLYLPLLSPLRTTHGAERFLHVISYAMSLRGTPGQVPVSALETIRYDTRFRLTEKFGDQVQEWDRLLGRKDYFFNPNHDPEHYIKRNQSHLRNTATKTHTFLSAWKRQWKYLSQSTHYPLEIEKTVPFRTTQTAANRPMLSYVTFIVPAVIGLSLELPIRLLLYFMVASSVLCTLLLGYWLIKITPAMKWLFVYLLLLPSICVQRSFIMTDAITLDLCFLLVALVLKFRHEAKPLSWIMQILLVTLSAMVATAKIAYFLIPAIVMLLPKACFASQRARAGLIAMVLLVGTASGIAWNLHAAEYIYQVDIAAAATVSEDSDISAASEKFHRQFLQLIGQPVAYTVRMFTTLVDIRNLQDWAGNIYFWTRYNHVEPYVASWLIYAAMASFLALAWLPAGDIANFRLVAKERAIAFAIFLFVVATIITIYYLGHAITFDQLQPASGFSEIRFMQGRFLLPALPLLLLAIYRPVVWTGEKSVMMSRLAVLSSFALLLTLHVIMVIQYMRIY